MLSGCSGDANAAIWTIEGRYGDAVSFAETSTQPDQLAFAARALLAQAISAPDHKPPLAIVERAEALARQALAADPHHTEARLQLAIALSLRARPLSTREARRTGFGEEARDLAQSVLEDDPDNSYAHGFLAVWHLEVRRRGGSIGASIMGASVSKARRHYQRAVAVAPHDGSIHWQYARALTALNPQKYRSEIDSVLDAAINCQSDSQLERVMQERATLLQSALQTEPRKSVQARAADML